MGAGRFRADLLARINVWVYTLPSLAQRREDIEPNVDYLLSQHAAQLSKQVRFNLEALAAYLAFAPRPPRHGRAIFVIYQPASHA